MLVKMVCKQRFRRSVATSNSGPFSRYLTSNKNIVGGALGVAGAVGAFFGGLAPVTIPVIALGLYGIGALLTPTPPVNLAVDLSSGEAAASTLRPPLARLVKKVHGLGTVLPMDVHLAVDRIVEKAEFVLDRGEKLTGEPEHLHIVARTITDYLPTSIEAYANLPRGYAARQQPGQQRSPHDELLSQLHLLEEQLTEVCDAVVAGDVAALANQGRFLEQKFRQSNLDL